MDMLLQPDSDQQHEGLHDVGPMAVGEVLPQTLSAAQIRRLTEALIEQEEAGNCVVLEPWHHFADGLIARTLLIKAGTVLTGCAHKFEHMSICAGDITVWTSGERRRLTGYHVLPCKPGAQRAGVAHADTYWTTVHLNPTNERDLSMLEDMLVHNAEMLQSRRLARLGMDQPKEIET